MSFDDLEIVEPAVEPLPRPVLVATWIICFAFSVACWIGAGLGARAIWRALR